MIELTESEGRGRGNGDHSRGREAWDRRLPAAGRCTLRPLPRLADGTDASPMQLAATDRRRSRGSFVLESASSRRLPAKGLPEREIRYRRRILSGAGTWLPPSAGA